MRNLSIEYLRVLFMALIVLLHLMQFGYDESYIFESTSTGSYSQIVLMMLGKLGVPGFIFITGYYGVKLSSKRLATLWVQTSFYAILSTLLLLFFFNNPISKGVVFSFLPLAGGYWFVEDYIILMLFSPLLNEGLKRIPKRRLQFIVVALIVVIYGILWSKGRNSAMSLLLFFSIYVVGRYCALYPNKLLHRHKFSILALSMIVLIFIPVVVHYIGKNHLIMKYIITYYNIFTLLAIVSTFIILDGVKRLGGGNILTKNVLAVYLLHCSPFGQKVLNEYVAPNVPFSVWSSFMIVAVVLIVSVIIDEMRKVVCKPVEVWLTLLFDRLYTSDNIENISHK